MAAHLLRYRALLWPVGDGQRHLTALFCMHIGNSIVHLSIHQGAEMVFNSLIFVVFFAVVLALHSMPLSWATRKLKLLIASHLFYAAWNPPFVILLWISTVADWYATQGLVRAQRPVSRRAWMLLSVIANLGMLGHFKYGSFLLANFSALMASFGIDYQRAGVRHRVAGGHLVLHLPYDVLHARYLSAPRQTRAACSRPRAVRDVLSASGDRANHATD